MDTNDATQQAITRLSDRHADRQLILSTGDLAFLYGTDAVITGDATDTDLDDVLHLLPQAQNAIDFYELTILDRARQAGRTWDQIGALASYGDRRAAQQRYRRLVERFPDFTEEGEEN